MSGRRPTVVAAVAGAVFASFYCFYTAAPLIFANAGAGARITTMMAAVVLIQPLALFAGRWLRHRSRAAAGAMVTMAAGLVLTAVLDAWPGLILLGAGFGVFVLVSIAWARDVADVDDAGRALGVYGAGSAIGGIVGAPVGTLLATTFGHPGVIVAAAGVLVVAAVGTAALRGGPATPPPDTPPAPAPDAPPAPDSPARPPGLLPSAAGLLAHLVAVAAYAAVLSTTSANAGASAAIAVAAVMAIQAGVAIGRLVSGLAADRWSTPGTLIAAVALLAAGGAGYLAATPAWATLTAAVVIGIASGGVQTSALTLMARQARTATQSDRVSAAWNIAFDVGLGAGAFVAVR